MLFVFIYSYWCPTRFSYQIRSFVVCMRVHLLFTLFVFACVKWCQFLWIDHFLIASSVFYNVNSCRLIVVRCVLHVEKKFTPIFSAVRVARTLLFCVMFYGLLFLVFCFSFSYYISVILRFTVFITRLVSSSFSPFSILMFGYYVFGIQDAKPKDTKVATEAVSLRTDNTMMKRKRTKMKNDL